jgi:hypothetical protein
VNWIGLEEKDEDRGERDSKCVRGAKIIFSFVTNKACFGSLGDLFPKLIFFRINFVLGQPTHFYLNKAL